ncbi:MAG: ABC transporter substrate-binding protein/permease [Carnobacterium sp.]|uniref:ABC transporter substrate-binding protein/permease n=1 Tax=Carnobacterium antarcticum TaxID=2126436 RepID=A0ABW4NKP3_9LACT|nr:ABC transporter substrate-binding protein/permease [Carnobacterium sp. CP1]ALV21818.1 Amino acid ABC transporter, amino acid-binding/permease protein [Carnobacterium sp. CP1]
MKNKKNTLVAILFSVMTLLLTLVPLTSVSAADTDPVYEKIQERGSLIVGLSADYAPYEFHATVDGQDKIVGFDISIAQKIADDLGVELKIEELGFDGLLGAMETGKIDIIISGMSPTPERLKEVNFSDAYMDVQQRVVVRKTDKDRFTSVDDFNGVKVGAQKQSTQEELAHSELIGSTVVSLQKVPDVIVNLQQKKVDAIILEGPVAEAYISQNNDIMFADVQFEDADKQTAVAISKEAPYLLEKINSTIKVIRDENLLPGYIEEAATHMGDDRPFFQKYGSYYLKGTGYTVVLAFIGVLFGSIIGSALALMKLSKKLPLKAISVAYIEYVRGTPLLVQIFLVYFGSPFLGLDLSAFTAGCIAIALNSGAYVAEIIRSGINAVDKGQLEAARSLGMNHTQAMRYIIFPQAIKNILPALGNEFVSVIKESSVVSVIGVSELMFQAGVVTGASFKPFLPILIASVIYFILTFTLSRLLGFAERGMNTSD